MTLHRIRENRQKTRPQATEAQREQRREAGRETQRELDRPERELGDEGLSLEDYEDRVAPAMYARDALCTEVALAIALGDAHGASPSRIVEAASEPDDADVAMYTSDCRGRLRLACLNYGIDPETGEPDRRVQRTIADALRAGHSEADALALAVLAAHQTIPAILMLDDGFQRAVETARCR